MTFCLETSRLRIRQFRDADLDTFLAYRNDPEVAKYQGWDVPYPREKALEFVAEMESKPLSVTGEWLQMTIEELESGQAVGDVAFFIKKEEPQAYVGCTIARPYWQKGYGSEAARRLLEYLFDELDLHRVIAITDVENVASFRTLERLGFRREGHFIENLMFKGKWASEYHYAMLKREWTTLQKSV